MSRITAILHTGVGDMLVKINNRFDWLGDKLGWNSTVYYAVAIALAVILGLWAMRLIKPICAILVGGIGYHCGLTLYRYLLGHVGFMEKWPDWGMYILGGVIGVLLAVLAWNKCLHAVLIVYAVLGYYLAINCIVDSVWIGVAGALLLALLAACVVRFAFILLAGTGSAYLLILALGKLLPKVSFLQLAGSNRVVPLCVFGTLAIVLTLIQRETTRSYEL